MKKYQWLFIIITMLTMGIVKAEMQEVQLLENSNTPIVRVIIKQTKEGYYLVQDFYKPGQKRTEPFLLKNSYQINKLAYDQLNIESHFILWHSDGRKWQEGYYVQGKKTGKWQYWQ